jgi:glycosyltransferase involved in cell wall biosynthesis
MQMRLGVNARRLAGQRLGIGRYIEYLVKHWQRMLDPADRVVLYVQDSRGTDDLQKPDTVITKQLGPRLTGLLWENVLLPPRADEMDVLFGPSYTMPLMYPGRNVVVIHSLNEAQSGAHPWWYNFTYSQIYRLSAQKADVVIVPSESAKGDVQKFYGIPASKIEIVAEGVDEYFRPVGDEELLRATRRRYLGADRPYILFVGKLSQRRNIPTLMTAFSILKKREKIPHSLLLFGPNHLNLPLQRLVQELEITDSVVQTDGRVENHQELVAVYSAAALYVNASLYEGFSLTLVEAMACGLPVVTVNRAALREIAGDAALLVDEPTADSLADAMARVLKDSDLCQELRAKSVKRARMFRWEDTARRTLDILRRVAVDKFSKKRFYFH